MRLVTRRAGNRNLLRQYRGRMRLTVNQNSPKFYYQGVLDVFARIRFTCDAPVGISWSGLLFNHAAPRHRSDIDVFYGPAHRVYEATRGA
jgi:hypothetical protein